MVAVPSHRVDPATTAMLREYEVLRAEVLAALGHRLQVWSFGAGAIAVLLAGALTAIAQPNLQGRDVINFVAGLVIAFVVPLFCLAVFHTWLSEVRRGRRASWYLWGLERRVNARLGVRALGWEEDLRHSTCRQMAVLKGHHASTMAFFAVTGCLAAVGGMAFLLMHPGSESLLPRSWNLDGLAHSTRWRMAAVWGVVVAAVCGLWFLAHVRACKRCEHQNDLTWPEPIPAWGGRGRA